MKFKLLLTCAGVLLALVSMPRLMPVCAEENVTVGFGTLKIGGVFQSTAAWYEADEKPWDFRLKRARLIFSGVLIPDRVKFFVQAECLSSPIILDTKLILSYIPKTEVSIGRFVPSFTLYMPRSTAKLDLINYPLTTSLFGMYRQTGVQSSTKTKYFDFDLGFYNGYQYDESTGALSGNDFNDDNDAKDFLANFTLKPMEKMTFSLFGWFGSAYDKDVDEDFDVTRMGANFEWVVKNLHLASEYVTASTDAIDGESVDSMAYFLQASLTFAKNWELLARYDDADPNNDVDEDGYSWITGGVNYSLKDINTKFFLNYIVKDEEGESVDNDEVVLMTQFSF